MSFSSPIMLPAPGDRLQRFVGDTVCFQVSAGPGAPPKGWSARLRTNLGRAERLRAEILRAHTCGLAPAGDSWRDVPMRPAANGWELQLPLAEPGFFKAKAYLLDERGWQHWPAGPDVGISVHPDIYRTGNVIYAAFPRMFGPAKAALNTADERVENALKPLDQAGYTVIPPSGKLRDLTRELPHIFDELRCRILHLLPVNPVPTTYARFGRFGSPYAALDLRAVDPALVVFDKKSTGVDQFRELTYAVHLRGCRVILDIVINHTGWGSVLQETHPEWFLREPDGTFVCPGAWDVVWEDLVEMKHRNVALWDDLADIFLTWCRRGVDGFRCDAGYMVPVPAWQYIVARVQQEYPQTLLLLEGLGGSWEATEALLTEGGMQWAYSELFQNYSGLQVSGYIDHALRQSRRVGLLVHYSETHDNNRLAAKGRAWSLLRNRLCALTSVSGGFGFTCGVEWLASEKIRVHGSTGMAWGQTENLLPELSHLNRLLTEHPCFFDGADVSRVSPPEHAVQVWTRRSAEGADTVLVVVNTDVDHPGTLEFAWEPASAGDLGAWIDLLGQPAPQIEPVAPGRSRISVAAGQAFCLAPALVPTGLWGEAYRETRAQAAWALKALGQVLSAESIGNFQWRALAAAVVNDPAGFLAAISHVAAHPVSLPLPPEDGIVPLLARVRSRPLFPRVITWTRIDIRRVTPVPPDHWLLLEDQVPFRAALDLQDGSPVQNVDSVPMANGHIVSFPPRQTAATASLLIERYATSESRLHATILFLNPEPAPGRAPCRETDVILLTNGRGAMARIPVDLGRVNSKYDCALAANLHPSLPVDRHVFAKRIRVWVNADGFISPLDFRQLNSFEAGPPATWNFVANAGDGRTVEIQVAAAMVPARNTTVFRFCRPTAAQATGKQLPAQADVRLTVRVDIEDRGFHGETHRNGGAEHHFSVHTRPLPGAPGAVGPGAAKVGFEFVPAADRRLRAYADAGCYHAQPEWSENIPHPLEQSRGQVPSGDAYSPGWFDIPLAKGADVSLMLTADLEESAEPALKSQGFRTATAPEAESGGFAMALRQAVEAFVVQRGEGKTVIAGYPWFLDWGRDTFICARGLLAAGMEDTVRQILVTFARFEERGTLPNTIFGENASNRDTTDAPLWFGVVCEELARRLARGRRTAPEDFSSVFQTVVAPGGRTLGDVLNSIAAHYADGTPNGIRMDPASGLIWSPSHFTWMDTNYPAGTPRQGYPVEIQALWIRLLRLLAQIGHPSGRQRWAELAAKAHVSLESLFWREPSGYYADVLLARPGLPASEAVVDDALRSNCLFVISLGLAQPERARRCVQSVRRHLVIPGALRSLAPLPLTVPLPVYGNDGRLLNNPLEPYWGRYEGDEDTQRKPAYHNGTGWTWTFPVFCEALVRAWENSPESVAAAKAYLGSMAALMNTGCLGHIPENVDGDAPHTQRGCDAQAWGATEALRVWQWLNSGPVPSDQS